MFERQNENERKASNFKSAQKLDGRVAIIQSKKHHKKHGKQLNDLKL